MTNYDELLLEAKTTLKTFQRTTAQNYIPRMYQSLRIENLTPKDAKDRIQKDCRGMWVKRTILEVLPDEAKDIKKQKAGRLRQKEPKSAALAAAPEAKEILSDVRGRAIDNSASPNEIIVESVVKSSDGLNRPNRCIRPPIECRNCSESAFRITELEQALRETTQVTRASEINFSSRDNFSQQEDNNAMTPFEFWLPLEDVRKYILATFNLSKNKDKLWFNGTLNRQTGIVVAANIGRILLQGEQVTIQGVQ